MTGTGGGETGTMAGTAGQILGGLTGAGGGKDGSFGATIGSDIRGAFKG